MTDNRSNSDQIEIRPWYKEPWLLLIIALPLASVIAGISTVIIAHQNADDLVNDDYYKIGIAINQNIEAQQEAISLGLHGRLFFSGERVQLQLKTEQDQQSKMPQKLMIELFHPTLKKQDVRIELSKQGPGLYAANYKNDSVVGRRYLRITPFAQDWSLKQEIEVEIGQTVILNAR